MTSHRNDRLTGLEVAVVGMHGRFPGANSIESFWTGLKDGFDGISRLSPPQLERAGVPRDVYESSRYIPVCGVLDDPDLFDHVFFGVSAQEARLMDPQHRVLLESAFRALEDAGYAGVTRDGRIGVFAGVSANTYLLNAVLPSDPDVMRAPGLPLLLGSDKDFAALRIAYHLGLTGPAVTIQTACSTGLSIVHAACRALQAGDCDVAIAAAACVRVPQHGYLQQDGSIFSPRGECRAFDADADGCVPGNGVAAVVLKRHADAVDAGDAIAAIVLGSALNNDAADGKLSFAAPSAGGQADVVRAAHRYADVEPGEIGYIEAHGTGTLLGDPVEVMALNAAFRGAPPARCGLGSVKTNIGHLDAAAGLAGFIKAVLAVRYGKLPPSIHFTKPNPHIPFAGSPFFVVGALSPWPADGPRLAGVSSFGVGGTNAHVVLMEPPRPRRRARSVGPVGLALSASAPHQLPAAARALADHLRARPSADLGDVAFTLAAGRRHLAQRLVVLAGTVDEAVTRLASVTAESPRLVAGDADGETAALREHAAAWIDGRTEQPASLAPAAGDSRRVSLPGAILAPVRHWVDAPSPSRGDVPAGQHRIRPASDHVTALRADTAGAAHVADAPAAGATLQSWTWVRRATAAAPQTTEAPAEWLLVHAGQSLARDLAGRLKCDRTLAEATVGQDEAAVATAIDSLASSGRPLRIVVACFADEALPRSVRPGSFERAFETAWRLPFVVARAISRSRHRLQAHVDLLTRGRFDVLGSEALDFGQWLVHGVERVLPQEHTGLTVRTVDVSLDKHDAARARPTLDAVADEDAARRSTLDALAGELRAAQPGNFAIRGGRMWVRILTELESDTAGPCTTLPSGHAPGAREDACLAMASPILVLGGFGGIGRALTHAIARGTPDARFALVARDSGETMRRGSWKEAAERIDAVFAECLGEREIHLIHDSPALVERLLLLCCARIAAYWRARGLSSAAGSTLTRSELAARSRVLPKLARMLDFQVACLADNGYVRLEADTVRWLRDAPAEADAERAVASIRAMEPELASVVGLLETCANSYERALTGEQEPISVLYPQGNEQLIGAAAKVMIRRSFGSAACRALGRWAGEAAGAAAAGRPFRILEVGAGNGLLTREIADAIQTLPDRRVQLIVTDIGRNLVEAGKAMAEGAGWRHVEFGVLDVTTDPASQGYDPGTFDLVCGLNVVHATPRVCDTLERLRSLLAPGGVVAIVESVLREPWVDMVAGLAEGWWAFADERQLSPLLSADEWRAAFCRAGLHEVAAFPGSPNEARRADCALIMGVAAGQPAEAAARLSEDASAHVAALRATGAAVEVVSADLRDRESVQRAVACARELVGPIGSVVHCAGRIAGGLVRNLSGWEIEVEFGARVRGALNVLAAVQDDPIEDVVLSSSRNVLIGGVGQAAYVSANAVLSGVGESLARYDGVRVTTVHWDRWHDVGLGRTFEERYRKLKGTEIGGGLSVDDAVAGLARARRIGAMDVVVAAQATREGTASAAGDTVRTVSHAAPDRPAALRHARDAWPAGNGSAPSDGREAVAPELAKTTSVLLDFMARSLGTPPLSPGDRLVDVGVDSLGALELQDKLQATFKVSVFSAALMTEPLQRIAEAILNPADHGSTVEVADPAAVAAAVGAYLERTS